MAAAGRFTLGKEERICSKKLMDSLFGSGSSKALTAFPLRAVFMEADREAGDPQVQMLVSVPKRYFKRAVMRNRVKRQVREAFRHQKDILSEAMKERQTRKLAVAFVWLDTHLHASEAVSQRVANLLMRIGERL